MEEKETVPLRRNKCKARRKNAEEVVGRQKQAKVQQKVRELKGEDCSAGELLEHRSEGEGREVAGRRREDGRGRSKNGSEGVFRMKGITGRALVQYEFLWNFNYFKVSLNCI